MRDKVPFEELLRVFVTQARGKLHIRSGSAWPLLAESAVEDLEASLLGILAGLLGQALELRFSIFRYFASYHVAGAYESFVSQAASTGLLNTLADYPILERLVNGVIEDWINCYSQLLRRLESDLPNIQLMPTCGRHTRKIGGIQTDLSDRHDGGHTAAILRFTDGSLLVYKPKNCASDHALYTLLGWLTERGALPLLTPRILARRDYAWVEFIGQEPCTSNDQARSYFRRAGTLLFAVYLLCGSDCHFDNLIACGEHPVLVDTETLFQPSIHSPHGDSRNSHTVFSTGLLPGIPVAGCDASAFGAQVPQRFRARIPQWRSTNTGNMELRFVDASLLPQRNVPMLRGKACPISSYAADFLTGFEESYRTALRHRSELIASDGPLQGFRGCEIRFLARGTLDYYLAINRALHLRKLRHARELAIELPQLSGQRAAFEALFPAELAALRRLDIPRLLTTAESTGLTGRGVTISNCFLQSGYARVMEKANWLAEPDLLRQIALIRISLA